MAKFASKLLFGSEGTDWEERINFAQMREDRLSKARKALRENNIPVCFLCQSDNIRYVTGVKFPSFLPQLDYALFFAESDPLYYQRAGRPMKGCPWIKPENVRLALTKWRGYGGGPEATRALAKKFADDLKNTLKEKALKKKSLASTVSMSREGRR